VKLVGFILIRDLEKLKQAYKNTYKSDIPKEYLDILTEMYEEQTRPDSLAIFPKKIKKSYFKRMKQH
jgi:hypothetical protein